MAQSSTTTTAKRYAVVTGGNKGIGFEICRQLASNGTVVVLAARDETRGLEALEKLKQCGISDDLLIFHQLDVVNSQSIACFADFVNTQFGKLDILVNNAGISGTEIDSDNFRKGFELSGGNWPDGKQMTWDKMSTQSLELAEQCVKINYYGAKAMVGALSPLLQLSDSARIVNVASMNGLLANIPNGWANGLLSDVERLSEDRVDEVVKQFLKDFEDGLLETKGWRTHLSAYTVAKAAMIAYTRILAIKYPSFLVNAVCPGFCRTDITVNVGCLTAAEGAESVVRLALLPNDGSSGLFYSRKEISCF